MSAVGMGGSYISDGALMEWLAKQQNRIYDDLRESMDLSETRAAFADELNDIKAHLHDANESTDFTKVDDELQAFMTKYASDPSFAKACEGLADFTERIRHDTSTQRNYAQDEATFPERYQAYQAQQAQMGADPTLYSTLKASGELLTEPQHREKPPAQNYDADKLKEWDGLIDSKTDGTSKNDQLTMIHIQELKATLDQGSQLASTFISSGDKTSSAIINNIA